MKFSESIKTFLAWIGLISIVPNTIILFQTAGTERSIYAVSLILILFIVWKWRSFLNYVRNIESLYSFHVINKDGDVEYEKHTSLLPLLWPIKKTEIFMSLSGNQAKIASGQANCPIEWDKQEDKIWHGFAKLPPHKPLLLAFSQNPGIRVELRSLWEKAVVLPPHDFIISCGAKKSSRIIMKANWCASMIPIEVYAQSAPFPVRLLLKKQMIDTTKIPWKNIDDLESHFENDGSISYILRIKEPRKYYMYRIFWKPPSKELSPDRLIEN